MKQKKNIYKYIKKVNTKNENQIDEMDGYGYIYIQTRKGKTNRKTQ